jgi:hypothetical protein
MTVEQFLERAREKSPILALGILLDLMQLLDEYESEKCSVLVGKMREELRKTGELPEEEPGKTGGLEDVEIWTCTLCQETFHMILISHDGIARRYRPLEEDKELYKEHTERHQAEHEAWGYTVT